MKKLLYLSIAIISLCSSCKKSCVIEEACLNFGTWNNTTCICNCPANYTGNNCETYSPPCSGKGTVIIFSSKSDPYEVEIDYSYKGNVGAYGTATFNNITSGSVYVKVTQASGYIFYPSVYSGTSSLSNCGTLNWSF